MFLQANIVPKICNHNFFFSYNDKISIEDKRKKMIIKPIYSSIFKRGMFLIFLFMSVLPLSAQNLITKQPEDITRCFSERYAVISLEAAGTMQAGYTFQWQRWDGSAFANILIGGGGPDYNMSFNDVKPPAELKFKCIVRYAGQEESSREVTLKINDVPDITGITVHEVCNGDDLTATVGNVNPNGYVLDEYKWTLDGSTVKEGSVTGNIVPGMTYSHIDVSKSESILMLTVTNQCGSDSVRQQIHVWPTPDLPTSLVKESYCQEEPPFSLIIAEPNPVWFNDPPGNPLSAAPIVDTSTPGTYSWWVLRQVKYPEATCESERKQITVKIIPLPAPPVTTPDFVMCLNDPGFTLNATGTDIKWYNDKDRNPLPSAPVINPSIPTTGGPDIYYVTQTIGCESRKNDGKISVTITNRAETEKINLPDTINLCPNTSRVIVVSSDVQNPTFRWYKNLNKTGFIQEGTSLETPVLKHDTAYYVTLTYGGLCESSYPKSVSIRARDIELPELTPPPNLEIETDPGECYASNVDIGRPTVSDNCTSEDKLFVFTDPNDGANYPNNSLNHFPDYFALGDTTLMWWVVDEARNTTRGLQSVSVRDREKPKGTCPSDMYIPINDNENSAIVYYELIYTDNCSVVKDSLNLGKPSGSVFDKGTTRVRHYLSDQAGNTETCEFKVIVEPPYRPMLVDLRISKNQLCPGEQVVITPMINGGSGRYKYTWKTPRYWTEPEMIDYPLDDTTYEVTVSDDSTSITRSVQISVLETRQVYLTLVDRLPYQIFEDDEVLVTATSGFASYKLLLNDEVIQTSGLNNGVSFQAELGTYRVRVFATDFSDCVTQDQMEILVDSRKLPNVFTPNFDGKNDIFLEGFNLEVYSRAGQLLYKGFNGWDGTFKGKMMPEGTYLYVVTRIMNNGEPRIFKDYVTLKL